MQAEELSFKYKSRWSVGESRKSLWKEQVKDHMFRSLISGCSFWTLFEALPHWHRASGIQQILRCFKAIELGKFDVGSFRPTDNMILQ